MTPDKLREWNATRPFPHPNEAQEIIFEGHRCVVMDPECYEACFKQAESHAAALEEIERLNAAWKAQHAAWKAQQFHLEAEERESAHWKERAEKAERRAERLKVHAEAMAEALESEIEARYAGLTDYPSMRRKYQQDMEEVEAYRAAYPKE